MTPEQLATLRERIAANRQPEERRSPERVFVRGWNEAMDFVERYFKEVLGEK